MSKVIAMAPGRVLPASKRQGAAKSTPKVLASWSPAQLRPSHKYQWLEEAVAGRPHEGMAKSLWLHHPHLQEAARKLSSYITPQWPGRHGESLLALAIQRAVTRADQSLSNGEGFQGRLTGVYLFGLTSIAEEVSRIVVSGVDDHGHHHRWPYFSRPLSQWASRQGLHQLEAEVTQPAASDVLLSGLKTHIVARLTDPQEAGYLAKYAPLG